MDISVRHPVNSEEYAHARGRNGEFLPRVVETQLHTHEDGTKLITFRVYSRRVGSDAPVEVTMALRDWREVGIETRRDIAKALRDAGIE